MKSTVTLNPTLTTYPCLMTTGAINIIALGETQDNTIIGVIVNSTDPNELIGSYSETWHKKCFSIFNGSVTLTN